MSWLNPAAAAWLLLVPALIVLYMLRPRSLRRPVSSLRLWRKLPSVDRPRARLRRPPLTLLLLLQALLLVAGAFALMQPALSGPAPRQLTILLDASGSMQTSESGAFTSRSRFEQAKDEVKRIASTGPEDRITLLRVGSNVTTVCSACRWQDLEPRLDALQPGAGTADWKAALGIASGSAVASGGSNVETYVVSDGAFSTLSSDKLPSPLHFVQVGGAASNRAITVLSARRPPDGSPGYAVYARVDNMSLQQAAVDVSALADTVPLDSHRLELPGSGHADLTWKLPSGTKRLTVSISPQDALAADNQAVLFLPAESQYKVVIEAEQPDLYERALAGIPGLEPATALTGTTTTGTAFTVLAEPLSDTLPAGNLLIVQSPRIQAQSQGTVVSGTTTSQVLTGTLRGDLGSVQGETAGVAPSEAQTSDPLLAGVDLQALQVDSALKIEPASWLQPVVQSSQGPLLLAGEKDGRRIAVLTFDPRDSNLPKLAAFPLLMANLADWLYPLASTQALRPGEAVFLAPGSTVVAPGDHSIKVGDSGLFADTESQGIYRVEGDQKDPRLFAVNMTNQGESNVAPRPHPELERLAVEANQSAPATDSKQEIWPPFAALALILVGGEWLLYCWKRGSA